MVERSNDIYDSKLQTKDIEVPNLVTLQFDQYKMYIIHIESADNSWSDMSIWENTCIYSEESSALLLYNFWDASNLWNVVYIILVRGGKHKYLST